MKIEKAQLFARLTEGHAAGITVVTPNTRLAQALVSELDDFQARNGKTAWEAADILPFSAFVQRLYEDAVYSPPGEMSAPELPVLLTPAQELWRWQEVVSNSGLLSLADTAEQCRKAWRLTHEWRIPRGAQGNEDVQAFAAWSLKYRDLTKDEVDAARLPDLVLKIATGLKRPQTLVAYAFDILPPQTKELIDACNAQYCDPGKQDGKAARTSFPSAKEEIESAARWARARLEEIRGQSPNSPGDSASTGVRALTPNSPRIGVVVPELEKRRTEIARIFSRVMQPGCNLPGASQAPMPFNVSLGVPLDQYPVVALALSVLEFSQGEIPFEEASRLIRSPFLGGAETELAARAKLDVKLRRQLGAAVSLPKLIAHAQGAPLLRDLLEKLFASRPQEDLFSAKTPSDWARHFSATLEAAGFPGERALDSAEYQARAKWHEALGELAKLDRVSSPLSFRDIFSALKRICAETVFQPESAGAPIQVLGILESAGLEFDRLWVSGLTDERWPLAASPNPFIPVALQKKAGIPEASAESSLALDRRITAHWSKAASEVVFSFHEMDEDRSLAPSPLILDVPQREVAVPEYPRLRDLIFSRKSLSSLQDTLDTRGPAVEARTVRGGTRVLSDQAACPFRAFANHRLAARELETPADGLDASDRGRLLHALMSSLWGALKRSAALQSDLAPAIDAAAAAAVKELKLEGRFAELERARLARLARDWLEIEKARPPFEVASLEEKRTLKFGNLEFDGRIDRMDKLISPGAGGHVLIDYKTSANPTPNHWKTPRPHDPQLPLYAVSAKEDIAAVAFAKVRPGEMRFMGFSREDKTIDGVRKAKAWEPLLAEWRKEAEALGSAFAAGEARVDPKRELQTCRHCGLQTLCRVYEKINPLKEADESVEGGGE